MADYLKSLEDTYSKLYKTKEQEALRKKQQGLTDLEAQQNALINQYQELQNALNARKQATQRQYQGLYTDLDNQLNQGKEQYYQDRNNASVNNVQRVQQIRDYMARNNLMSSGENVDATLRANTDYNNSLGNIYGAEQQFTRGINDKRNEYSLAEQNAYTDIDNQLSAADREKAQKLAALSSQRNLLDTNYLSELQSYKDQLDADRVQKIAEYNEKLRQEELQKQQIEAQRAWEAQQAKIQYERQLAMQREAQAASLRAARARSRGGSKSSSGLKSSMSSNSNYNKEVSYINDLINGQYNYSEKIRTLEKYIADKQTQNGNEAKALAKYAQSALVKAQEQLDHFVNVERWKNYGDYLARR